MPGWPRQRFIFNNLSRGDLLVLVLAFSSVTAFYLLFWQANDSAGQFVHIVNGQNEIQKVSLFQNQEINIKGDLGDSRLQIQGGRVRFLDSPCSNKLCVHQGWVHFSGEILACLPNKISVSLVGQASRFDTINF